MLRLYEDDRRWQFILFYSCEDILLKSFQISTSHLPSIPSCAEYSLVPLGASCWGCPADPQPQTHRQPQPKPPPRFNCFNFSHLHHNRPPSPTRSRHPAPFPCRPRCLLDSDPSRRSALRPSHVRPGKHRKEQAPAAAPTSRPSSRALTDNVPLQLCQKLPHRLRCLDSRPLRHVRTHSPRRLLRPRPHHLRIRYS